MKAYSRVTAIILRIVRQFWRDKRSLAMLFAAPLLILTLMSLIFQSNTYQPAVGLINASAPVSDLLVQSGAAVTTLPTLEEARTMMRRGELDAALTVGEPHEPPLLLLEGSDPSKTRAVQQLILKAMGQIGPSPSVEMKLQVEYMYGSPESTAFEWIGPVLIGVMAFFFVFLLAGISFLRERTGGTLERLLASPLRRWELVIGYTLGFGIFTTLQTGLIAWFSVDILDMRLAGSIGLVLLSAFMLSLTALSLGTFLSAYAANDFQMIQFIPIVIVPQVFFSGLFPIESMAEWLQWLSLIMPLTYGAEALRDVMLKGAGLQDIAPNLTVLAVLTAGLMAATVLALRKHRKL